MDNPRKGRLRNALSGRGTKICLVGILVIAATLRIALALEHPARPIWPDGNRYNMIANHIVTQGEYPSHESRSAPLHPVVLAAVYGFTGSSGTGARMVTCIFGTMTCLVLYGLGKSLFSRRAGLIAALILAFYPLHVYMSGIYEYPQTLFILLLSIALYQLTSLRGRSNVSRGVLAAGLSIGLAVMTVPTLMMAVPFLTVWLLFSIPASWHRRLQVTGLFATGFACVVFGWTIYIYSNTGEWNLGSGAGAENLFKGNCSLAWQMGKADIADRYDVEGVPPEHREAYDTYKATMEQARKFPAGRERDAVYKAAVYRFVRERPKEAMVLLLRKAVLFWWPYAKTVTRHEHNSSAAQIIQTVSFLPIVLFACISLVVCRGNTIQLTPIYIIILAQWITYSMFLVNVRYRLHADVLLILLAAPTVLTLTHRMGQCATACRKRTVYSNSFNTNG